MNSGGKTVFLSPSWYTSSAASAGGSKIAVPWYDRVKDSSQICEGRSILPGDLVWGFSLGLGERLLELEPEEEPLQFLVITELQPAEIEVPEDHLPGSHPTLAKSGLWALTPGRSSRSVRVNLWEHETIWRMKKGGD